ncbi:hypothetical protein MESMUL_21750 [Mesosutterella multiformis]|uniref:Uncharacterized protein n=1 Tax=Mesosutterella multiformis TaxID=2259133 RepID=A0A388SHC5_9BURK|nr:hypothetical protein MESMUL_21750 [Mesosutterella multiformis]
MTLKSGIPSVFGETGNDRRGEGLNRDLEWKTDRGTVTKLRKMRYDEKEK